MSNFSKKGIIEKIWPENKSVELVNVNTREEYNKRKYLASLSGLAIRNEEEIEKWLSYFGQYSLLFRSCIVITSTHTNSNLVMNYKI